MGPMEKTSRTTTSNGSGWNVGSSRWPGGTRPEEHLAPTTHRGGPKIAVQGDPEGDRKSFCDREDVMDGCYHDGVGPVHPPRRELPEPDLGVSATHVDPTTLPGSPAAAERVDAYMRTWAADRNNRNLPPPPKGPADPQQS